MSGVKKNGLDRHWAGSGVVWIEESAVAEYLRLIGASELEHNGPEIIADLPEPAPSRFITQENAKLER